MLHQNKKTRSVFFFLSSLIIGLLSLPFTLAKSASGAYRFRSKGIYHSLPSVTTTPSPPSTNLYDSMQLRIRGLSKEAFENARKGFKKLLNAGQLLNDSVITIIDFTLPSSQKRLFVLDIRNHKILFHTLVAHGRNSGRETAVSFSNKPASNQSSPGFYRTAETYNGKNGYSLKLEGLEPGINDRAMDRAIVVHGASYVNEQYIQSQGYIGRSQGCPAIPVQQTYPLINSICEGSCLFIYHPSYIGKSELL